MSKVCPAVHVGRTCGKQGCALVHTVYRCRTCRAPFASQTACRQHEASGSHRPVYAACDLCSVRRLSPVDYKIHVRGRKHKKLAAASQQVAQVIPAETSVPPHHRPCAICDIVVSEKDWSAHVRGRRHLSKQTSQAFTNAINDTKVDKYDIRLDCDRVNFGVIGSKSQTVKHSRQVKIVNDGSSTVVLTGTKLASSSRGDIFHVDELARRCQLGRTNSTSVTVRLSATKDDRGMFENRLELYFEVPSQSRRFAITRLITARIGSKSDYEELKAAKPYVPRKGTSGHRITRFIEGIRPQMLAQIEWARKLKMYDIPAGLDSILSNEDLKMSEKLSMIRSTSFPREFGASTYAKHMQTKLWTEEERASRELSEYDRQDAKLAPRGKLYELQVPGLAEKRPSVIVGDRIFVNESGRSDQHPFEGFVHAVENGVVLLCFNKMFSWARGRKYEVRFNLNRLVFRRMHQACEHSPDSNRITFPRLANELKSVSRASVSAIQPFDDKISSNEPQHRAITSILHMPAGSIPFIIYGPPGTGKTMTMVEAIRQIITRKPSARILACAPSNSAADIIVERLAEHVSVLGDKSLFRLIAPSRSPKAVSQRVLNFTRINGHGVFESPPRTVLETYRIVVSTCCSGGVPYGMGFSPGHFTHVFIDEAAQATEPEVMIPIRTLLGPKTNVILSGDVKQLGPIVRSPIARELGLGTSFLERLMSSSLYDEDSAKGKSMVKLTKNYRSHPEILGFPNSQFYKNELQPCGDPKITHSISKQWNGLVKKGYPVIFHGVCGQDEREDPSPSYFNSDEAIVVRDYVRDLLADKGLHLTPHNIGVITPYRAQVLKLRKLLCRFAKESTVGSVEEFQGQERRVIIISTVRSSREMINFDLRHTLGFVANPRRFNVAVTRAQSLLIVVGDPYVLALDPMWKEFINYVHLRGGYTGKRIDWDPAEPVDRTTRLDEARRAQGISKLEELIRRTSDLDLNDAEVFEDAGAFREED